VPKGAPASALFVTAGLCAPSTEAVLDWGRRLLRHFGAALPLPGRPPLRRATTRTVEDGRYRSTSPTRTALCSSTVTLSTHKDVDHSLESSFGAPGAERTRGVTSIFPRASQGAGTPEGTAASATSPFTLNTPMQVGPSSMLLRAVELAQWELKGDGSKFVPSAKWAVVPRPSRNSHDRDFLNESPRFAADAQDNGPSAACIAAAQASADAGHIMSI